MQERMRGAWMQGRLHFQGAPLLAGEVPKSQLASALTTEMGS
jgi:hypothetical protein